METVTDAVSLDVMALVQVLLVIAVALGLNMLARRRYANRKTMQTRLQVIQATLIVAALILIIVVAPIGDSRRGQLLSFFGIVISAAVALSSTTVLGNAMAGLMLRSIKAFKPGDYIYVGEHVGRVTEMDLLHVEIQTEESDLTTLSNVYLVSNPYRVVRAEEGTILSVQVSLGYDVAHDRVEELLKKGITEAGLEDAFVHVVELGDFSVTYRAAGKLKPAEGIIGKRSQLRACTLDALHGGDVEIVSPNFMNTRALPADARIIPEATARKAAKPYVSPDDVVFDKADEAESLESMKQRHEELLASIAEASEQLKSATEENKAALTAQIEKITAKADKLLQVIHQHEEKLVGDK